MMVLTNITNGGQNRPIILVRPETDLPRPLRRYVSKPAVGATRSIFGMYADMLRRWPLFLIIDTRCGAVFRRYIRKVRCLSLSIS